MFLRTIRRAHLRFSGRSRSSREGSSTSSRDYAYRNRGATSRMRNKRRAFSNDLSLCQEALCSNKCRLLDLLCDLVLPDLIINPNLGGAHPGPRLMGLIARLIGI
jgi:hypothetical protein